MNNQMVDSVIQDCQNELQEIEAKIQSEGNLSSVTKYLTRYALIKISGTFEFTFKNLIADYYTTEDIEIYLSNTLRDSSVTASLQNIQNVLRRFDESKNDAFKNSLNGMERNTNALNSLSRLRNQFAHGNPINVTFSELKTYFSDCVMIFQKLDSLLIKH